MSKENRSVAVPKNETTDFTVLGSGVMGVLVAKTLAEHGHRVTVVSSEGMPSQESGDSTTSIAVGQFLPWVPEGEIKGVLVQEAVEAGREFYNLLAQDPHTTGVMSLDNIEFVSVDAPWPIDLPEAMNVMEKTLDHPIEVLDPENNLVEFDTIYTFPTFSINVRKTLGYLAKEARNAGVQFVQQRVSSNELDSLDGVIINAAGPGSEEFDETKDVTLVKGHTFRLLPNKKSPQLLQAVSVDDLIIMPREDGTIVCGALYLPDPTNHLPEADEVASLIERLSHLVKTVSDEVDGLDPMLFSNSTILSHSAGLRVKVNHDGVRVAPDKTNERLLHAYGFSGIGWSVGPHFASRISQMARDIHSRRRET